MSEIVNSTEADSRDVLQASVKMQAYAMKIDLLSNATVIERQSNQIMFLKNLHNLDKIINSYQSQLGSTNTEEFELLRGLPFYNWVSRTNIRATPAQKDFKHAIGLPQKNGQSYPLFDYEQMLFDILQKHEHVWIKKATGLGITEFMLRYMAWLCLKDNALQGSQICIITVPREDLAVGLIDRMKVITKLLDLTEEKSKQ